MSPDRKRRPQAACAAFIVLATVAAGIEPWPVDAASGPCAVEAEPNDRIEDAPRIGASFCQSGTLTENDQDLVLWTVEPSLALFPWTFEVAGVPRTITSIHVLPVTSPADTPAITVGSEVLRVDSSAESRQPGVVDDVVLPPGRYVLGISKGTNTGPALDDLAYQVRIAQPGVRPSLGDLEPNDVPEAASPVTGAFAITGDLTGSPDLFRWTIEDADAGRSWALDARALAGSSFTLSLLTDGGVPLASAQVGPDAYAHLYDLRLEAGSYLVHLGDGTADARPYVLGATLVTDADVDAEPNDAQDQAVPITPGSPARGRLAGSGDVDSHRLTVDAALAATQLSIRLEAAAGLSRQVCLYDASHALSHCRQDQDGLVTLSDLLLSTPGDYFIEVSGTDSTADRYTLRVDAIGPPTVGREVEPNEALEKASPLDVLTPLQGHADGIDDDLYHAEVTLEPQLWRVDVTGDGVEELEWLSVDTLVFGTGALAPEGSRLVLRDLWLPPGDHWFRIRARESDYTVTFTPLGAPPTDSELEPNDSSQLAGSMIPGQRRVGRLTDPPDVDVYRFSLAASQQLAIVVAPPTDGAVRFGLSSSGVPLADVAALAPGEEVRYQARLPAGDYEVHLVAAQTSEERYTLTLEQGDPFSDASSAAEALSAEVSLSTEVSSVAGWWPEGQRVDGVLSITSRGPSDLRLSLAARTSDDAWSVDLPAAAVDLPAGGSVTLPIVVHVPADAWSDVPVRITLRAEDANGAWATSFADVVPLTDVQPVNLEKAWQLPSALLGGRNVAAFVLGAQLLPGPDPVSAAQLFDGHVVPGAGYQGSLASGPLTVDVDLAGDLPQPIGGFILDPLAAGPGLAWRPRDVEVLLSDDGIDFRSVLQAELSPVTREQAFVLDPPVPARFARLRISSSWSGTGGTVALGEWKVVAAPGAVVDAAVLVNLADPALGGHVVIMESLRTDDVTIRGMLTEDPTAWLPNPADATSVRWTLGFRDDRAATITRLEWVDPPGVDPAALIAAVDVEVSSTSALGPWTSLAGWILERAADGTVTPLDLPDPAWARFLRFTTTGPAVDHVVWAMPATLRVMERPTGDGYLSALGEWGRWEPRGIMELMAPVVAGAPTPEPTPDGDDDRSTARPLAIATMAGGQVRRGVDQDWFVLRVPPDDDLLTLTVGGEPFAAAGVSLFDAAGAPVELEAVSLAGPSAAWSAIVEPGASYAVLVEQLPVSTVFTYDTSGSMVNYLPFVADALRTFARGIVPGLDAALIIPFDGGPLLDEWTDDPVALQQAVASETLFPAGSSAAEKAILAALDEVDQRPGIRALVVLTDAETDSRSLAPDVWAAFERVRPLVFTIHTGELSDPALTTPLMQDWAASSAGVYQLAASHRDIERTFQRLAAWLRRPAGYTLTATAAAIPKEPGTLSVTAATRRAGTVGGVTIELVLDTSGSMLKKLGRSRRIDVAERVLTRLVTETLPPGLPVMLRTFVALPRSCATTLAVPLGPLEPATMAARIAALKVAGSTRTPLGATLHAVGDDLADVKGTAIVVFVTDGQETCKGDPAKEIQRLIDLGIDVRVNIVGFAIDDPALTRDLAAWAALGNGTAYDADNEKELTEALTQLLRAPYTVFDEAGTAVATGLVGGDPVSLPVGSYRVEVQTDPPVTLDPVVIGSGVNVDIVVGEEA